MAFGHAILAGLMTGSFLVLGVACWHLRAGRNVDVFAAAARLAIIVAVPVSFVQLGWGSEFGVATTDAQPMKIAAAEALWDTEEPAAFSLFQIGGFTEDDQTPSFDIEVPGLLSFLATNHFGARSSRHERAPVAVRAAVRRRELHPGRAARVLEHARDGVPRDAVAPARALGRLAPAAQAARAGDVVPPRGARRDRASLPSSFAGWILTEAGRQPWVVYGLLRTEDAVSGSVSAWTVGLSLGVFVSLYTALFVIDVYLMRRYARLDPPEAGGEAGPRRAPEPAPVL